MEFATMPDSQRILLLRDYTLSIFNKLGLALDDYQMETGNANTSFTNALYAIKERERQLQNAELSLAVTAPMKAGKSTILNAIIGDGILPSRALAMTVLPTRVHLCHELEEPRLLFSQSFHDAVKDLLDSDDFNELNWGDDCVVTGATEIRMTLTLLNDKVRTALQRNKTLRIPLNSNDMPEVHVKAPRHLDGIENGDNGMPKGTLVLIDTPGPNEANIGDTLQVIVRNILQEVSMVAVVLDFTQLTSEAAELTKNEVTTISSMIGSDNVIYLVNKVDQRRPGDLMSEAVETFISQSYENTASVGENLFEISASKGCAAGGFIRSVAGSGIRDEEMRKMPIARSLAQELYELWEEELEDATVESFTKKATRLWSNSGIEQFLSVCIEELVSRSYEKTVLMSIDYISNQLQQLEDQLDLQISASSSSTQRIAQEISLLGSDIMQAKNAQNQSRLIQETRKNVQDQIYTSISDAKQCAQLTIRDFFGDDQVKNKIVTERAESSGVTVPTNTDGNNLSTLLDFFPRLLKAGDYFKNVKQILDAQLTTLSNALTGKGTRDGDVLEFSSRDEANAAMRQIKETLDKRVESYVQAAKIQVEDEVSRAQEGIRDFTQETTQKVLINAQARLNEAFNSELSLPSPTLNFSYDITGISVHPGEAKRRKNGKISTEQRYLPWYTLWGVFGLIKQTVQVETPGEELEVYQIDMQAVVCDVNSSIAKGFESMRQVVEQYILDDLQKSVGSYYDEVNAFLARYQQSLQLAQSQASKSADEQDRVLKLSVTLQAEIKAEKDRLEKAKSGKDLDLYCSSQLVHDDRSTHETANVYCHDLVSLLNEKNEVQAGAFVYDSYQSRKIIELMRGESVVGTGGIGGQMVSKAIGDCAASLIPSFAAALKAGQVMRIVGPPSVVEGLANGTMALMQSGSNSLGTIVSNGSSNIVGQAQFISAGGVVAPLLVYQAVHVIVGTQQLNQINRRLASIERTLSRIVERQNAKDIGEIIAAASTLQDVFTEHADTGHFTEQMQGRILICERDIRAHHERLMILRVNFHDKIEKIRRNLAGNGKSLELAVLIKEQGEQFAQDIRLLLTLSSVVIQVEYALVLIALEHNPSGLPHRQRQLSDQVARVQSTLSDMLDLSEIKSEISACLNEMNWWQREIFSRGTVKVLSEAISLPLEANYPDPGLVSGGPEGGGMLIWHDLENGTQTRAIPSLSLDGDNLKAETR
jgi:hypothetical protein